MKNKKYGDTIREEILEAGLKLWRIDPSEITTRKIGQLVGRSNVAVFRLFPNGLKKAIAEYGIQKQDSVVIVSLILTNDPLVTGMTRKEKEKHLNAIKSIQSVGV